MRKTTNNDLRKSKRIETLDEIDPNTVTFGIVHIKV
jgi:hypothetical protein